jgi:hypothetical protein
MNKKELIFHTLILFLILTGLSYWYFQDFIWTKGFALKQETSDWAVWQNKLPASTDISKLKVSPEIPNNLRPGLLLRYAENNNVLLLSTLSEKAFTHLTLIYIRQKR